MKPTVLDCPSFMWACAYLGVFTVVLITSQSVGWSVLSGAFCGALALEVSVFKGGECPWLPTMFPTKFLFHLLALLFGVVVLLPAFAFARQGGLFVLFPAFLGLSFAGFFIVHLREHSGPPTSEQPVSLALKVLAALPFFVLGAFGLVAAGFIVWALVGPVHP